MVDLFGKTKLKDRLADLEARLEVLQKENEELLRTLEKREDKIRKLSSAYQEVNLALKASEQRTTAPHPAKSDDSREIRPSGEKLGPREIERLMNRLLSHRSPYDDLVTAYLSEAESLPPGLPAQAGPLLKSINSERGWLILHSPQLFTLQLVPPFPIRDPALSMSDRFELEAVREMMEVPVMVVSAHAGDTFLGMALGSGGFEEMEIVKGQVKEKHSKGGFSQKRFERLREEDIKNHLDEVSARWASLNKKYSSVARYVVMGGDPVLLKRIPSVSGLPVVARRLERHDEKRPEQLLQDVYSFRCYRI